MNIKCPACAANLIETPTGLDDEYGCPLTRIDHDCPKNNSLGSFAKPRTVCSRCKEWSTDHESGVCFSCRRREGVGDAVPSNDSNS